MKKNISIVVLVIIILLLLISKVSSGKYKNVISDSNIWWSGEWKKNRIGKEQVMYTNFFGSEIRFNVVGAGKLIFESDITSVDGDTELEIVVDDKIYSISNPNFNTKRVSILLEDAAAFQKHRVVARYYCTGSTSPCDFNLRKILIDKGKLVSKDEKRKILAILGDSVSLIYAKENYAVFLSKGIDYHLLNSSVWARSLSDNNGRDPAVRSYENIIIQGPEILIVFLGTNDVTYGVPLSDFRNDYISIVKNVQKKSPNTVVLLLGILSGKNNYEYRNTISEFNLTISSLSDRKKVYFVDTTDWLGVDDYGDQYHPNVTGQKKIAERLLQFLQAAQLF